MFTVEGVVKRLMVIITFAALASACVPIYGPAAMQAGPPGYPYGAPMYGPAGPTAPMQFPVGRWSNVMMLPDGASIEIFTADGRRTTGSFVTATNTFVRIGSAAGELDVPAATVMRVDWLSGSPPGAHRVARDAVIGAAGGVGIVGLIGLVSGEMPRAGQFAAGAITAGYANAQGERYYRRATTIYVAPASAPK